MGFEEFLPDEAKGDELEEELSLIRKDSINQNQIYDIITSRKPDWQQIIYDLISSEQLDPWDIDLVILTKAYFEKILELDEQDFYISSKVLLAAALLLRIKSEFLLNKHIRSIDDILFGKKEDNKYVMQRIEINEDELPVLIPKTPMSRLRKVTLSELMNALNRAIDTESRRIKREVAIKRAKKLSEVDFPTFKKIDLKDRIKQFYARILTSIKKRQLEEGKSNDKHKNKINYFDLVGCEKEEKLACFLPLLHLSNSQKLWIEQEKHLDDIFIYLYEYFDNNREFFIEVFSQMEEDVDSFTEEEGEMFDSEAPVKNPQDNLVGEIEDVIRGVESEMKELDHDDNIEKETGFSVE